MCGILGQITFADGTYAAPREEISPRLISMMARRGPDDEGFWSDGRHCVFAFRRLAILDLSKNAHQPMLTRDGRYVLVYNGEVYNFSELRRELEHEGVAFRSTGDTEVVLYALAHWGKRALSRFNGMFALGFYDSVEKRLLLARDHAGIKPLYYMLTPRGLVFASQYDQILAHRWSQRLGVSGDALGLYLRLGYIPAPYALLQNTHMLEPGTWLETTGYDRVRSGRFFDFPVYREPDLEGEEAFEAVDAAVTAAVRRQMVSDVPLGTFLSGGVDSPLVAAKLRALSNGTIRAFSMGTDGDHLDESTDAIAYAREIGVEHFVEHITPNRALDMLDDVVAACGEPFADYSIFPTILVSRLARQQVKVMLSGDGGDELFWGYVGRLRSILEQVIEFNQISLVRSSRQLLKKALAAVRGDWDAWRQKNIGDLYRVKHSHRSEDWLPRILPDCPQWPSGFSLFYYRDWELNRAAQWLRWNEFGSYLPMMLLKVDRGSMYHSLEVRVPLLDREVIDVAARVNWRSCLDLKCRIGKLPLRYSLARHVRHQTRTKRGFTFSMDAWLRGSLRPVFEELVLGQQEILGLPVNQKAAREIFNRHLSGQARYGYGLWSLLSLVMWEKRYHTRNHSRTSSTVIPASNCYEEVH